MPVKAKHMDPTEDIHKRVVTLGPVDVPISQADVEFDQFTPGYAFEILGVEVYSIATTASSDVMVKIGSTDALAAAVADPAAKTPVAATLHATEANVRGSATDVIGLFVTTDGSGDNTGLRARVTYRALGIGGLPDRAGTV